MKTNEQRLRLLCKKIAVMSPIHSAVLAERLLLIAEMTLKDIGEHSEKWNTGMIHKDYFIDVCEEINTILK